MTPTNRTTAELRVEIEKLRSLVSDWRNAETRAGLCADPDDLDLEGLSEAAEEANYCYDMAATHFMLWSEDILDALLPQPPALGGQVCQDAKNKIVAAILRYPPETMTEAERIADDLVQAIVPTQEEWRPFKGFSQIEENATYEVTDGNHHWFAQKEWFDDDTDGGWLFSPCLRNGEDDWREDEPIIDSEGRNSITHFKPVLPLPPGGDNG